MASEERPPAPEEQRKKKKKKKSRRDERTRESSGSPRGRHAAAASGDSDPERKHDGSPRAAAETAEPASGKPAKHSHRRSSDKAGGGSGKHKSSNDRATSRSRRERGASASSRREHARESGDEEERGSRGSGAADDDWRERRPDVVRRGRRRGASNGDGNGDEHGAREADHDDDRDDLDDLDDQEENGNEDRYERAAQGAQIGVGDGLEDEEEAEAEADVVAVEASAAPPPPPARRLPARSHAAALHHPAASPRATTGEALAPGAGSSNGDASAKVDSQANGQKVPVDLPCGRHPAQELRFFCTTCQVPICVDCRVTGEHQGSMHLALALSEAYASRLAALSGLIASRLHEKRQRILAQLQKLQVRSDEVRHARLRVELDTQVLVEEIVQRLKLAERGRQWLLEQEMEQLRGDLARMEAFVSAALKARSSLSEMAEFLASHRALEETCERLAATVINTEIPAQAVASGLPEELRAMHERARSAEALIARVRELEGEVARCEEERRQLAQQVEAQAQHVRELDAAANQEMQEWIRLTDRFADELRPFRAACRFCGVALSATSASSLCPRATATMRNATLHKSDAVFGRPHHFELAPV